MRRIPCRRRLRASDTGSAMVELAVALPILVALLVGTADFARVFPARFR